jgi:8-oxo-dGTP pyrophosphatase MutT (NUDIX family)
MSRYRLIARRLAGENERFRIFFDEIETPSGEIIPDFLIVKPKVTAKGGNVVGVCVLPHVGGRIGLMRAYRHQLNAEIWQAPAGFIDDEESSEEAAMRELAEETGLVCSPERLRSLGGYVSDAGLIEGSVALFVAEDPLPTPDPVHGEVGVSELTFFDRAALRELTLHSSLIGGSTLVSCMRFLLGSVS